MLNSTRSDMHELELCSATGESSPCEQRWLQRKGRRLHDRAAQQSATWFWFVVAHGYSWLIMIIPSPYACVCMLELTENHV